MNRFIHPVIVLLALLPAAPAVPCAASGPAAEPPEQVVGKLLAGGCDAHREHVHPQFRSEGGCEGFSEFFRNSEQRTEALVQGDRALVTRSIDRAALTVDYYFHLRHVAGRWKLVAVRSLATPQFIWNSCLSGAEGHESTMRLMCMSDAEIIEWFEAKKAAYEALRTRLVEVEFSGHKSRADEEKQENTRSQLDRLMENAGVSSVDRITQDQEDLAFALTVTGIIDNSVGFIWSSARENLPELDPGSIIMLRPLGDGWWLFKTT